MRAFARSLLFCALLLSVVASHAERASDILTLVRKDDWKAAYSLAGQVSSDALATNRERGVAAYAAFRAGDVRMVRGLAVARKGSPASAWQRLAQSALAQMDNDMRGAERAARDALKDRDVAPDAHAVLFSICQVEGRLQEAAVHARAILDAKPTGYPFDELLPQLAGLEAVYTKIKDPPSLTPSRRAFDEIPLETTSPYLSVSASINGKEPVKLILDTGGSVNPSLSPSTAKKLKVETVAESAAFGFGGVEKVQVGKIDSLTVGRFTIGAQPVAVIKMLDVLTSFMGVGGVLDARWLMGYTATVDFEKDVLRVSDRRPFNQPRGTVTKLRNGDTLVAQPFALVGDSKILLPINLNGEETWAMFDTGSPLNMLSFDWMKSTMDPKDYKISKSFTGGVGTTASDALSIVSKKPMTLTLAGYDIVLKRPTGQDSLDKQVSHGLGFQVRALLGLELFRTARSFTIDGPARTLYIVFRPTEADPE